MANDDLLKRLGDAEDNFVERKPANPNRDDIRRTVVAFANSAPEGRSAVLFIGVRNDGTLESVPNTDKLQKTVREVCEQDCYPRISFSTEVLYPEGGPVLAVVVPASTNRPHFTGAAYIRRGSESVVASAEAFDELIHSRNSKCAAILKLKGKVVTVLSLRNRTGFLQHIPVECVVEAADPHTVRLKILSSDRHVAEPLEDVKLSRDEERYRAMLILSA